MLKPEVGTQTTPNDEFFYRKFSDDLGISNLDLSPIPQRSKKNSNSEHSLNNAESKMTNGKAKLICESKNGIYGKNNMKMKRPPEDEEMLKLLNEEKQDHDSKRDGMVFNDYRLSYQSDNSGDSSQRDSYTTAPQSASIPSGAEPVWWTSFSDIPYVDESSVCFSEGNPSSGSSETGRLLLHMADTGLFDNDSLESYSNENKPRSLDSVYLELVYTSKKKEKLMEHYNQLQQPGEQLKQTSDSENDEDNVAASLNSSEDDDDSQSKNGCNDVTDGGSTVGETLVSDINSDLNDANGDTYEDSDQEEDKVMNLDKGISSSESSVEQLPTTAKVQVGWIQCHDYQVTLVLRKLIRTDTKLG